MSSQGDHKPGSVGKGAAVGEHEKPELVMADGLLVPPITLRQWEEIKNFQARPDDTFIASYPKSGLVWTTQVMEMIQLQGDVEAYKANKKLVPFLEFSIPNVEISMPAVKMINNLPSPRVINIHSPISHISKSILEKKCKVICVLRNPKDVVVSYYHFHTFSNIAPNPGTWSEFLQNFMIGKVAFSSWFDHVKGWWSLRKQPNIFFLFYEAMKKDLGYEAGRLASFLGRDLSPEAMKNLVEQLSFNSMKTNMDEKIPNFKTVAGFSFKQFIRKGQVGDWKNHFTVAQNEVMDQLIADQLKGTSLDFCYEL
uniref:sulfotransferase 1C2-like isoform X1 n=1 Tax=Myxine glutinosa TaxID=7769 RepID=UPI00358EA902